VTREDDKVHFVSHRTSGSKKTTVDYKHFDESVPAKNTDVSDKSWLKDAGKKPTIKSDLKNFKNFLTGKKETNEAYSMDDVRKDAAERLKKSLDKQSDDRIAALKNPPKKKGFFARVGDKQINMVKGAYKGLTKEEAEISEAAPFKTKEDAVKYAKEKVKTHRDNLDGIEVYAHSGGFDVNHTSNSSGRNSLHKVGAKHLGTIYKEEVEQVEEGRMKDIATNAQETDRLKKDDVPFDGPYTKTKPTKNSDGTTQSPMSRARELAKNAMKQKMKEEFGLDITDEQADSLVEASYAPVAPVPDKKYIKGTPENKAYKATKKPINGMPTKATCESVELEEANHREFASQGKMHPDMAKHMTTGQEMDYYEHGTGDKVSGKVLKNDGKEVHIKQTHDSYDPKKKGTVHKFKISDKLDEKAPPGFEGTVKAMKKHKEIDNPYALAWYMKNKGMKSHKEEFDDNGELITNMKSYKEFLQSLDEVKMSDLPSRKVSGKYGTEYYKGEAEADKKGYDDEDKPAKPAGEKRGRGRPAGSTSGARQKGTIAKRKGSGVEMTGYPVHLPNFK
jgi:hypothetical protein